jgi:transcriptional regulator with XRE-family HTH domain
MTIGERIKIARKASNLKQADLAEKIGVHEVTLRTWENGNKGPNSVILSKLAAALSTSVSYLIGETDDAGQSTQRPEVPPEVESSGPNQELLAALETDPMKLSSAKLLSQLNDEQTRKAYEFLRDQKQLGEFLKEKGLPRTG